MLTWFCTIHSQGGWYHKIHKAKRIMTLFCKSRGLDCLDFYVLLPTMICMILHCVLDVMAATYSSTIFGILLVVQTALSFGWLVVWPWYHYNGLGKRRFTKWRICNEIMRIVTFLVGVPVVPLFLLMAFLLQEGTLLMMLVNEPNILARAVWLDNTNGSVCRRDARVSRHFAGRAPVDPGCIIRWVLPRCPFGGTAIIYCSVDCCFFFWIPDTLDLDGLHAQAATGLDWLFGMVCVLCDMYCIFVGSNNVDPTSRTLPFKSGTRYKPKVHCIDVNSGSWKCWQHKHLTKEGARTCRLH